MTLHISHPNAFSIIPPSLDGTENWNGNLVSPGIKGSLFPRWPDWNASGAPGVSLTVHERRAGYETVCAAWVVVHVHNMYVHMSWHDCISHVVTKRPTFLGKSCKNMHVQVCVCVQVERNTICRHLSKSNTHLSTALPTSRWAKYAILSISCPPKMDMRVSPVASGRVRPVLMFSLSRRLNNCWVMSKLRAAFSVNVIRRKSTQRAKTSAT